MECTLLMSDNCNMRCTYCYEGPKKYSNNLNENDLEAAIFYMISNNESDDMIDLLFLGGEPLLNKKMIYKALDIINNKYTQYKKLFRFQMTTNGVLIDDEDILFFKENHFDISVSIDGDMKTHNLNRKSASGEEVYFLIIKNMKKMLSHNINIAVRMTITLNNVEYLCQNIKYFYGMGVKRINLGIDELGNWTDKELQKFDEQLDLLEKLYLSYVVEDDSKILNIFDYKLASVIFEKNQQYCSAGTKGHIVINSKGEFYPCGYVVNKDEWKLGTLEKGLDQRRFLETVKKTVKKVSSCKGCEIAPACCGAKCGFLNYTLTGYLNVNSEVTCKLQKMIYYHVLNVAKELYRMQNSRILFMLNKAKENGVKLSAAMEKVIV